MNEPIYRPGLEGIVAGETAVSCLSGGLRYRGYAVEDLCENAKFGEVAYLILQGEKPTADELAAFQARLAADRDVPADLLEIARRIPETANMMDVMRTAASLLGHWDANPEADDHAALLAKSEHLLAGLPVVMAAVHRHRSGQALILPADEESFAAGLLHMLRGESPTVPEVEAMDTSLTLYAEHEFNASAFAARVVTSTLSDVYSAVTAAIGALKGPLHGGANERAMEVLLEVGGPENAESWVRGALAEKRRIMGFGHRVYKNGDPRAKYLDQYCKQLAEKTGNQGMEQTADTIQRIVLEEKGLHPNVDWPCARLYHYLGLPVELYTPLFVCARVTGWCAHFIEQFENNRLIRPSSKYVGPEDRTWNE